MAAETPSAVTGRSFAGCRMVAHRGCDTVAARLLHHGGDLGRSCWPTAADHPGHGRPPVATLAAAGFAVALCAVAAVLIAAATSRRSYRRIRLGVAGGVGIVVLDSVMLAAVLLLAPTPVWPMVAAVPASLARISLTLRALPMPHAR